MNIAEIQVDRLQTVTEQFRAEIFAYIRSRVGDTTITEDLTQETFLKVSKALAKGAKPEHLRGWLYQIARNAIIDFRKETQRSASFDDSSRVNDDNESVDPADQEFRKSLFDYVLKVIEALPPEDRETLRFTELDGLSRSELATELGISLAAAKSRVHRAREKLRQAVEECCRLVTDPYGRVIDWKRQGSPCCRKSAT